MKIIVIPKRIELKIKVICNNPSGKKPKIIINNSTIPMINNNVPNIEIKYNGEYE